LSDKGFPAFLFRVLLEENFKTKTKMARELGVQLRTLQLNFQNMDEAKGGCLAFERAILYCCEQEIDIMALYHRYVCERDGQNWGSVSCGDLPMRRLFLSLVVQNGLSLFACGAERASWFSER
jgi:hypothetical protein